MDFTITLNAGSSLQAGPFDITITNTSNVSRTYATGITRAVLASGYWMGGLTNTDKTITATSTGTCTTSASIDISSATGASTSSINGNYTVSPSVTSATGTITVVGSATTLRLAGFGGATSGGNSSATVTVTGTGGTSNPSPNSINKTIGAYTSVSCLASSTTMALPVGTYYYSIVGTFIGAAGHNMYLCLDASV
jgi:hypothetical protein